MERSCTPNLDAQSDLIVSRTLYSILLAARAGGTKVQAPLTKGWRNGLAKLGAITRHPDRLAAMCHAGSNQPSVVRQWSEILVAFGGN